MDKLKPFEKILEPDSRQKGFALINRKTGAIRERTLQDHYSAVEEIQLSESVPEKIREHFETARNLMVYSWFVYRFIQVAWLQAFASLEFALREKVPEEMLKEFCKKLGMKKGFACYLRIAIEKGWIKDSEFRYWVRGNPIQTDDPQTYCKVLMESLPNLRNELAHGSNMAYPDISMVLKICADLINQLYKYE